MSLSRHPQSGGSLVLEIGVEVKRSASVLALSYVARGDVGAVSLPKRAVPARADGLWQRTCFEAFVRSARESAYWEFNLSPSLEWAAYRFDAYRQGMTAEFATGDPRIEVQASRSEIRLSAALDLCALTGLPVDEDWRLGVSAIIEDGNGDKSYWALVHSTGKPDFHRGESFALALSP